MELNPKVLAPIAILVGGGVAAAGLIAARSNVETRPPKAPPPLVRTLTVAFEDIRLTVPAQGTVAARTESDLVPRVSGEVIDVSPAFADGGYFRKGDVLVRIDPRDYELALASAHVQVAQAELQLAQEEEEGRIAREEWDRIGEGEPTALVLRLPQLRQARASLEAARAGVERAELNLERTVIRAPFEGRVRATRVDVGQVVGPSMPLGRIYAVDYVEVELPVPDPQLAYLDLPGQFDPSGELRDGPEVELSAEFAGRHQTWMGRIVRVGGEIDPQTRMVHLVARVQDPYGTQAEGSPIPLAVGLFVEAGIYGIQARNVVVLPRAVLRGRDQVLVVEDEQLFYRRVEVLKTNNETAIITSGLEPGDRVCVSPLAVVVNGMRVRVMDALQTIEEGDIG